MKILVGSLLGWQKRFGTENPCAQSLAKVLWPQGFQYPAYGSMESSFIIPRKLHQCSQYSHQVSVISGTLVSCHESTFGKMILGNPPDD